MSSMGEQTEQRGTLAPIAVLHDTEEIARYLAHTGETTPLMVGFSNHACGPPLMAA